MQSAEAGGSLCWGLGDREPPHPSGPPALSLVRPGSLHLTMFLYKEIRKGLAENLQLQRLFVQCCL